jgi:hypothetical protein
MTAIAAALYGGWAEYRAKKHKREVAQVKADAARLAKELNAIRTEAGTKASWEEQLVTDARAARALGKTPPPGPTGQ